jgi:hypothetical protein
MGLVFPSSPSIGQTYPLTATPGLPQYQWDGVTWIMKGSAINPQIYVADAAPSNPVDGALWWDSMQGILYLRYFDGDSRAWVQCAPSAADYAALTAYTDRMVLDTDTNLVINGGMEVSQEFGSVAQVKALGAWGYTLDQWNCWVAGNGAFAFSQMANSALPLPVLGFRNIQRLYCTTAFNMAGASDLAFCGQPFEGQRWARLGWGAVGALPITVSFWVRATIAGTLSVPVKNGTANRCYVAPVTINTANTWEYKQVTIPGDTTGTWPTDTAMAALVGIALGAGSGYQTPPNVWTAGNFHAFPGITNFYATANNDVFFTGFSIVPGSIGPSAAQSPLMVRQYDADLQICQRYWETGFQRLTYYNGAGIAGIGTAYDTIPFLVQKRIAPVMSVGTTFQYYNTADGFINFTPNMSPSERVLVYYLSGGTNWKAWTSSGSWKASARM